MGRVIAGFLLILLGVLFAGLIGVILIAVGVVLVVLGAVELL